MAETAFLDLMAYTRGQRAATLANQADARFNATQPYLEAEAARRVQEIQDGEAARQANVMVAQFTADVIKEATAYPAEGRAGYIAARIAQAMQQVQDPRLLSMLNSFALNQSAAAKSYGDVQGASALFNVALGQQQGGNFQALQAWQNPATWANAEAVAAQGGQLQADGSVLYAGFKWAPDQFAQQVTARLQQGGGFNAAAAISPFAAMDRQQAAHNAAMQSLGVGAAPAFTPAPGGAAPAVAASMPVAAVPTPLAAAPMPNFAPPLPAAPPAPSAQPAQMQTFLPYGGGPQVARPAITAPAVQAPAAWDMQMLQQIAQAPVGAPAPLPYFDPSTMQMPATAQAPATWLTQQGLPPWR